MTSFKTMLVLLFAAFLLLGCQSSSNPETAAGPTAANPASSSASPSPSKGTGDAHLLAESMYKATSWHVRSEQPGVVHEIDFSCPDKMRTVSTKGSETKETIQVGSTVYSQTAAGWKQDSMPKSFSIVCGENGVYSQPTILGAGIATMTKGEMATVNGEGCRLWTIRLKPGITPNEQTTCVGDDNLPRQTRSGPGTLTYSAWNKPVAIEAPK